MMPGGLATLLMIPPPATYRTTSGRNTSSASAWPAGRRDGASRESSIDCGLDEVGREECERDRHVQPLHAAALTSGDAFGIRSRIGNEFVQPTAPPCNRCTRIARFSERMGRASRGGPPSGTSDAAL